MEEKIDMTQVLEDCEKLGIINMQTSGNLTPALAATAVQAVKEINLDFKSLAKRRAEQQKKRPHTR